MKKPYSTNFAGRVTFYIATLPLTLLLLSVPSTKGITQERIIKVVTYEKFFSDPFSLIITPTDDPHILLISGKVGKIHYSGQTSTSYWVWLPKREDDLEAYRKKYEGADPPHNNSWGYSKKIEGAVLGPVKTYEYTPRHLWLKLSSDPYTDPINPGRSAFLGSNSVVTKADGTFSAVISINKFPEYQERFLFSKAGYKSDGISWLRDAKVIITVVPNGATGQEYSGPEWDYSVPAFYIDTIGQ